MIEAVVFTLYMYMYKKMYSDLLSNKIILLTDQMYELMKFYF